MNYELHRVCVKLTGGVSPNFSLYFLDLSIKNKPRMQIACGWVNPFIVSHSIFLPLDNFIHAFRQKQTDRYLIQQFCRHLWPLTHSHQHTLMQFLDATPSSCFQRNCTITGDFSYLSAMRCLPRSRSLTSDVSFSPSARRILSICLLRVIASFWFFELMQPIFLTNFWSYFIDILRTWTFLR